MDIQITEVTGFIEASMEAHAHIEAVSIAKDLILTDVAASTLIEIKIEAQEEI